MKSATEQLAHLEAAIRGAAAAAPVNTARDALLYIAGCTGDAAPDITQAITDLLAVLDRKSGGAA